MSNERLMLKNKFNETHKEKILVIFIFLLNCFMVLSKLTPEFLEINPYDGVKYIESGRKLLTWGFRDLSWGPLVAVVYAPIHMVVGQSLNWFMLEAWIGNVVLFAMMWFGFLSLAYQLKSHISKYVYIGILFSSSIFIRILQNQSDALFVTMSVLALGHIVRYRENSELKNIGLASLFVGLGVLSRIESILLVIPLILFTFLFNSKRHKSFKLILACLSPLFIVLISYIIINLLTFGQPKIGLGGKSYFSFTHPLVQNFIPGSKNHEAYLQGEPIFGTVEENNGSVFKAILRNPVAVGERILANILEMPKMLSSYFGDLHYRIIVFFSLLGIYALIKMHNKALLLLLLVWPSHALITLIFESFHFIPQISYLLLILSGIGITYSFSEQSEYHEKVYLFLFVVATIAIALLGQYKALFAFAALLFVVSLSNLLIESNNGTVARLKMLPLTILLAGALLYGNSFTFPAKRLGQSESERAVYVLQRNFPKESNVIAQFPRPAVAAKMNHISFPNQITNINDFIDYLIVNKIVAVYVNDAFPFSSEFDYVLDFEYSDCITEIHKSESGDIRIYETEFFCD